MDIPALSQHLRPAAGDLIAVCNTSTPTLCAELSLTVPGDGSSKRGRLYAALDALMAVKISALTQAKITHEKSVIAVQVPRLVHALVSIKLGWFSRRAFLCSRLKH